jgi:hypothetical protein
MTRRKLFIKHWTMQMNGTHEQGRNVNAIPHHGFRPGTISMTNDEWTSGRLSPFVIRHFTTAL